MTIMSKRAYLSLLMRQTPVYNENFEVVHRPHGDCWKHKTQDYWIVYYESLKQAGKPGFSAYRAIEGCYKRDPWTVNNKVVGRFHTLDDAA